MIVEKEAALSSMQNNQRQIPQSRAAKGNLRLLPSGPLRRHTTQVIDHHKMKTALVGTCVLLFLRQKKHSHYGHCKKRNLFLTKKQKNAEEQLEKGFLNFDDRLCPIYAFFMR